jgi:hypothetical protein
LVHPSPHLRAAARAAICLLAAVAAVIGPTSAPPTWADHDSDSSAAPTLRDVPPDHPWREDTRLALSTATALPGRGAEQAHRLARQNLVHNAPPELRHHVSIGPVRGDRFTVTIVGDQACAIWPSGRPHRAKPGPCAAADRVRLRNPLKATAHVVGSLYDHSLGDARTHRQRVEIMSLLFPRAAMANVAWTYAPPGVGVAGLIDDDEDGLDDDARVTLHGGGRALCLRLGAYPGQRSTSSWGQCRNLEPRAIRYPPGVQP